MHGCMVAGEVQVQRHLQLRIEAQGKYMQTILEKACQTLAGENMPSAAPFHNINKGNHHSTINGSEDIKDFGASHHLNFPSLQDLNIYGSGGDHQHHQLGLQQSIDMDRSSSQQLDGGFSIMPSHNNNNNNNNDNLCLVGSTSTNKKRPPSSTTATPSPPYGKNSGASLMWSSPSDDLRLQELGTAAGAGTSSCIGSQSQDHHHHHHHHHDPYNIKGDHNHHQIQNIDHHDHQTATSNDIDSISSDDPNSIYETKPAMISGEHHAMGTGDHQNQKTSSSLLIQTGKSTLSPKTNSFRHS